MGLFASVNGPGYGLNPDYHNQVSFYYIADQLLELEPWLNKTTACTFPDPWRDQKTAETKEKEAPTAANNFTEYSGSYEYPLFPNVEVYANSSNLLFTSNHIHGVLHPSSDKDRFLSEITYPWEFAPHDNITQQGNLTFLRDEGTGAVTALTVQLEVNVTYVKKPAVPQNVPQLRQIMAKVNSRNGSLKHSLMFPSFALLLLHLLMH